MSSQIEKFYSFLWPKSILLYIYTTSLFVHPSVDTYLLSNNPQRQDRHHDIYWYLRHTNFLLWNKKKIQKGKKIVMGLWSYPSWEYVEALVVSTRQLFEAMQDRYSEPVWYGWYRWIFLLHCPYSSLDKIKWTGQQNVCYNWYSQKSWVFFFNDILVWSTLLSFPYILTLILETDTQNHSEA